MLCSPTRSSGPVDPEHLLVGDAELGDQQLEHLRGDRLLDLEPHRRPEAAAQQLLLERLEEVLGVVLLDLEVLVAGDPEGVDLEHLHAREEPLEVLADDVLERHEALVAQRHEAAEDRRHLDPREVLLVGLGVADQHGEVEREPGDVGERVGRVDRQRREHREDPVLEQPLAELLLLAVELVPADQLDALLGQLRHELLAEEPGVPLHQVAGARPRSARAPRAASARTRRARPRPAAIRRLRPATRTMKNSSRLLAKIAAKRTRSSSGWRSSSASSRTRWLKRSQDSSRSRKRSSYAATAARAASSGW